jgi:ADP-heptose:LPS heptosyltransferase
MEKKDGLKYVAIFHGCLNDKNTKIKDVGCEVRQLMLSAVAAANAVPVILGTNSDLKKFWNPVNRAGAIDYLGQLTLRDSVSVLSQCDYFISNDTGLYHVAGALGMKGLVLWVKTDSVKNKSPANTIVHVKNKHANSRVFTDAISMFCKNL